jgi:hypothetical protein
MPFCERPHHLSCLPHFHKGMALSRHFTPSTQAILTAQQQSQSSPPRSPSPPHRTSPPKDHSIIVISSSPDERPFSHSKAVPLEIPSGDESDPFEQWAPLPRPEESGRITDNEDFTRLLGTYKHNTKQPLKESVNVPRPTAQTTRKTSLDTFFQECKPAAKTGKNRVKTTLTSRVALPKPKPTPIVATSTLNNTAAKQQSSFFTTWATAQAPATRSARATSRKKPTRAKKNETEVVLLSPQSGKESVRKRAEQKVDLDRRLGEKRDASAGVMWDASNRGLEGELYDVDGSMIFSQELRLNCAESCPEVALQNVLTDVEVEVVSVETLTETTTAVIDDGIPARRRGVDVDVENLEDGMPPYSTYTLQQLQVLPPFKKINLFLRTKSRNSASKRQSQKQA